VLEKSALRRKIHQRVKNAAVIIDDFIFNEWISEIQVQSPEDFVLNFHDM